MQLNHCFCLNQNNDDFLKWYVELLGPVLLGAKPAEILSFPQNNERHMEIFFKVKELFSRTNKILHFDVENHGKCKKVFFYHPAALEQTLNDPKNLRFLESLGYPRQDHLEGYVHHLLSKMEGGRIPDEIGIFLGYPLKDVIGFMGHPALQLTKVDGWRIYGDAKISDQKRQEILAARDRIKQHYCSVPPMKLYNPPSGYRFSSLPIWA